ncbi:exosortase C-terminal domain/associated protein EpsI [Geoalkalibacter halelectricus]|uniref:EpsI family protein n=1 Tax=Geoalkalibacter halelectricus TaxID=2847045 RepID=A0ABY5ZKD7_9BACT|nr:exosortase C-terminal domain/associated protein EpsI [Geoalkalibacter halelectricus]MDO3379769.1 EpsI family protein [Geoalkalibacter halelectricus]UWZ79591.1 EpsI family protein [Geoalkalibacter halelectricus]
MGKRLLLVGLIVLSFAFYVQARPFHDLVPIKQDLVTFPMHIEDWQAADFQLSPGVLEQLRVSNYLMRDYRRDGESVNVYIGYYETQREGAQIHSPRHCLPGSGWVPTRHTTRTWQIDGQRPINLVEAVYQKDSYHEVFLYWYQMKDATITNEYLLKAQMVFNSLKYRRNDAAFIRLSAPVRTSVEDTVASLESFMADFVPLLDDYLPE